MKSLPLSELRDLYDVAHKAASFSSDYGITDVGSANINFGVGGDRWFFVVVGEPGSGTSGTNEPAYWYAWSQATTLSQSDFASVTGTLLIEDILTIAETEGEHGRRTMPLVEINGITGVPDGTRVMAWLADSGDMLLFSAPWDGAAGGSLTLKEQDGTPSYTSTTTIEVNQADGLVLTQPSANTVLVSIQDADASQAGIVSTGTQTLGGNKSFANNVIVGAAAVPRTLTIYTETVGADDWKITSGGHGTGMNRGFIAFFNGTAKYAIQLDDKFRIRDEFASPLVTVDGGEFTLAAGSRFNIDTALGVTGTDPVGNVFTGGIVTTRSTTSIPTGSGTCSGTNTGDQLVFKTIAVSGQSDVVADTTTDTLTLVAGTGITLTTDAATDTITIANSGAGSGTVTSVDLLMPSIFFVSGNPVTTAGALSVTLATQPPGTFLGGPTSGASAVPTFRALQTVDMPPIQSILVDAPSTTGAHYPFLSPTTAAGTAVVAVVTPDFSFDVTTTVLTCTGGFVGPLTGNVTGNVSGSATRLATPRTIGMTGDVTWTSAAFDGQANVSAAGTIAAGAVTLAKQANVASGTLFYRTTAGAGAPEVNTLATLKTDLGLSGINTGDQTLGSLGAQPLDATLTALAALTIAANSLTIGTGADAFSQLTFTAGTFPARASTGSLTTQLITDFALTLVDDADAAAARSTLGLGSLATQAGTFSGTSSGTNTGDQTITLTGDVTGSGTGSFAATIGANKVTDAMLRQSAGLSVPGRSANTTGNVADITGTDGQVLRVSGTTLGFGTIATAGIAADAVTYAKMQNVSATDKVLGRSAAGPGDVEEIPCTSYGRSVLADTAAVGDESGQSFLSSTYTITAANGTFVDSGVSVTLPSAGTYWMSADVRGSINMATGTLALLAAELYNATDGAVITNSERLVVLITQTGIQYQTGCTIGMLVTVATSKVIKLYVKRDGGTTYTTSQIATDTNGRTMLSYVRIY